MTRETDDAFFAIANEVVAPEAFDLLNKHLEGVVAWRQECLAEGKPADLRSLIVRLQNEKNRRGPVLAAYAAAIWKLLENEGRL